MMNRYAYSYKINHEGYPERNQEHKIAIFHDGEIELKENIQCIRMIDERFNWFRPRDEIEFLKEGEDVVLNGRLKFIRYDATDGVEPITVVFSCQINHNHMDEMMSHILFESEWKGSRRASSAGFWYNGNMSGKSETIGIDYQGNRL